jgi:hypothetical protein
MSFGHYQGLFFKSLFYATLFKNNEKNYQLFPGAVATDLKININIIIIMTRFVKITSDS